MTKKEKRSIIIGLACAILSTVTSALFIDIPFMGSFIIGLIVWVVVFYVILFILNIFFKNKK